MTRTWLRWGAAAGLTFAAPALAIEPGSLRLGVQIDLEACLDHEEPDPAACVDAANRIGDPAWAAWIADRPNPSSADDRFVLDALRCADGSADACRALATRVSGDDRGAMRVRHAMLLLEACGVGDKVACAEVGAMPTTSRDDIGRAFAGDAPWSTGQSGGAYAAYTLDARELARRVKAVDGKDPRPADALRLAQGVWQSLGDRDALENARTTLRGLCAKDATSSACALADDIAQPTEVFDRRLAGSVRLLDRMCDDGGVGRACMVQARLLAMGRASPYGTWSSRVAAQDACNEGLDDGCSLVTAALRSAVARHDEQTCLHVLATDARGAQANACLETQTMYRFGVGAAKDEAKADERQQAACEHGAGDACLWIAEDLWEVDPGASAAWYERACDSGQPIGCSAAGRMMMYGDDIAEDQPRGLSLLRKGAAVGVANAWLHIGLYESDKKNDSAAREAFLRGCGLGDHWSCGALGAFDLFRGGRSGITFDESIGMMTWACELGDEDSCGYIGVTFTDEDSPVPLDDGKALWGWRRVCEAIPDDEEACTATAELEAEGVEEVFPGPLDWPDLTPPGLSFSTPSDPYVAVDRPGPSPGPRPGPGGGGGGGTFDPAGVIGLGFGTQRAWTADNQASSFRLFGGIQRPWFGVGAQVDWVSDARWRPKVARDYFRLGLKADVSLQIPLGYGFAVELGAGGGAGIFRQGPGTSSPIEPFGGPHEFFQLDFFASDLFVGVRVEQQQLFHKTLGLDHVTSLSGLVGVRFD